MQSLAIGDWKLFLTRKCAFNNKREEQIWTFRCFIFFLILQSMLPYGSRYRWVLSCWRFDIDCRHKRKMIGKIHSICRKKKILNFETDLNFHYSNCVLPWIGEGGCYLAWKSRFLTEHEHRTLAPKEMCLYSNSVLSIPSCLGSN